MLAHIAVFCAACILVSIGILGGVAPWSLDGGADGGPVAVLALLFPLACCLMIFCELPLLSVSMTLSKLQKDHQLRTPPLVKQGKNARAIVTLRNWALGPVLIAFPIVGAAWGLGGLFVSMAVVYGCFVLPSSIVASDQQAMLNRTELAIKAGWVELQLDRIAPARLVFLAAHKELLEALGSDNLAAWSALPGLLAATKQMYQSGENDEHVDASTLQQLRSTFERVATEHLEAHGSCTAMLSAEAPGKSAAGQWRTHQATVLLASGDERAMAVEVLELLADAADKYGACVEASVHRHRPEEDNPAWSKFIGEASFHDPAMAIAIEYHTQPEYTTNCSRLTDRSHALVV
jgi:hypothetical protein